MSLTNSTRQDVLIIEDDAFMQKIIKSVLNEKYEMTVFSNGLAALSHLQDGNIPALIISDLNTPQLNGFGFLEQLKSSEFFKDIPILILSGETGDGIKDYCMESGAEDFLAKPFSPSELEARVRVIFNGINN